MTANSAGAPPTEPDERTPATVVALLRPSWVGGTRYGYLYDVIVGGETIVSHSHAPEHDACRALLGRGVTGMLTFVDVAGRPRSSIDIEKGAAWTVVEDEVKGLLIVPYQAWPGSSTVVSAQRQDGERGVSTAEGKDAAGRKGPWRKEALNRRGRETGDDYPHVILRIGEGWRIVGWRNDIQWIVQRRAGSAWRNLGFSRTSDGVRALLSRNGLDPAAADSLPALYPEHQRAAPVAQQADKGAVHARQAALAPPLAPEIPDDESPPPLTTPTAVGKTEAHEDRS